MEDGPQEFTIKVIHLTQTKIKRRHPAHPRLREYMRTLRGDRTITEIDKQVKGSYYRWEIDGRLPLDEEKTASIAKALGCTIEDLKSKLDEYNLSRKIDLLPFIKAVATADIDHLLPEELEFVSKANNFLGSEIDCESVEALIKNYRKRN